MRCKRRVCQGKCWYGATPMTVAEQAAEAVETAKRLGLDAPLELPFPTYLVVCADCKTPKDKLPPGLPPALRAIYESPERFSPTDNDAARRSVRKAATALGVGYRSLRFQKNGEEWKHRHDAPWASVEATTLAYYCETEGWAGHGGEGGLVLSLIKAASFPVLPQRHRSCVVEALYAQNVAPDDRYEVPWLLSNVLEASSERIEANFAVMASPATGTPECLPTVTLGKVLGLFSALGVERLHAVAQAFAQAPYDLRAGWPDLTLWRTGEVAFREVKADGDSVRPTQARLVRKVLKPLGFDVELVEVVGDSIA